MAANVWVWMANPHTGDKVKVLQESFEKLYARKGWELTTAPETNPVPLVGSVPNDDGGDEGNDSSLASPRRWDTDSDEDPTDD